MTIGRKGREAFSLICTTANALIMDFTLDGMVEEAPALGRMARRGSVGSSMALGNAKFTIGNNLYKPSAGGYRRGEGETMKTYRNTSEYWGDNVGGVTVDDYRKLAATFASESGEPAAVITSDDKHIYADGVPVADVEVQYRGVVYDRMSDTRHVTRTHRTWEAAQRASERLCQRRYGRGNDRYGIRVETLAGDTWEAC